MVVIIIMFVLGDFMFRVLCSSQLRLEHGKLSSIFPTFSHYDSEAMKNLSSLTELMGNASTAAISMGKVKGFLSKLHKDDPKDINFGFSPDKDMSVSTVT